MFTVETLDKIESVSSVDARPEMVAGNCFHCGLPVPPGVNLQVKIDDQSRQMCCHGCQAVARAIVAAGHEHYYRVRTAPAPGADERVPDFLSDTGIYDDPVLQRQFVQQVSDTCHEASLMFDGITCAACIWLNEQHLAALPGVDQIQINYTTHRATLRWNNEIIQLSEILQAIREIGYRALPYDARQQHSLRQAERRTRLRQLALTGLFGMQVMMLSISLYTGAWTGMEQEFEAMFRWLSLGLTIPVIIIAANSFFRPAWRELSHRRIGMDLPVSLGIGIAFGASLVATLRAQGEIYFDSVVMFTFFLLLSRYLETMARQRAAASVERFAQALPLMANRICALTRKPEIIAATSLAPGDLVLVRAGETLPADGEIVEGLSSVDESLLTGESLAIGKMPGDLVVGGSTNIDSPLQVKITAVGPDTLLAGIQLMVDRAQTQKPALAQLADRVASRFILAVLLITALVAVYWWLHAPQRWLEITLATLIVTCPCALSLATPAALTAALARLQSIGLLVTRGQALETLDQVTHVVFDKTGTLTLGKPVLTRVLTATQVEQSRSLSIAASMEFTSEHPLAQAIVRAAGEFEPLPVESLMNKPGRGIKASIQGQEYAIGSINFISEFCAQPLPADWMQQVLCENASVVVLATRECILSLYFLQDELRPDAPQLVSALERQYKKVILMTGDCDTVTRNIALQCGIRDYACNLSPAEKMSRVKTLQAANAIVLMVGDGVNDAPVISAADVSIAMMTATSLAKLNADIVLMTNRLGSILDGLDMAHRVQNNIRQNFSWALGYNFCAIPLAASGLVAPWMAALGMSFSSLIVVINALRLSR